MIEKESLKFKELERVLIEKSRNFFGTCSSVEHDAPDADAATAVPVDRVGYFFTYVVPTASPPPQQLESGLPERFDGVMAPYNEKAARGISARSEFSPEAYVNDQYRNPRQRPPAAGVKRK